MLKSDIVVIYFIVIRYMCSFQTRTYAQLLRMRACCKFFKQEGQKVRKSIKLTIETDILIA